MPSPTPDTYYVATKAFLRRGDTILICKDIEGKWDLPGGRIAVGEFETPLDNILDRELKEELGDALKYRNNGPVALFRHKRPEITELNRPERRIFMIGFDVEYLEGEISLSDEHTECRWVKPEEAVQLLKGGQRQGAEAYMRHHKGHKGHSKGHRDIWLCETCS